MFKELKYHKIFILIIFMHSFYFYELNLFWLCFRVQDIEMCLLYISKISLLNILFFDFSLVSVLFMSSLAFFFYWTIFHQKHKKKGLKTRIEILCQIWHRWERRYINRYLSCNLTRSKTKWCIYFALESKRCFKHFQIQD